MRLIPAVENPASRLDATGEPPSTPRMRRLSPIEHARTRDRVVTMSLPDRGPEARSRNLVWLEQRAGEGWFYAKDDHYAFGAQADATAFKQWLISALA